MTKQAIKEKILGIRFMLDCIQSAQIDPLERELEDHLRKLYPNCPQIEEWALDVAYNDRNALDRMDNLFGTRKTSK